MPLYSNAIRDERVRDYLPVRRVMLAERVEGSMSLADKAQLEEVDRQRSSK